MVQCQEVGIGSIPENSKYHLTGLEEEQEGVHCLSYVLVRQHNDPVVVECVDAGEQYEMVDPQDAGSVGVGDAVGHEYLYLSFDLREAVDVLASCGADCVVGLAVAISLLLVTVSSAHGWGWKK